MNTHDTLPTLVLIGLVFGSAFAGVAVFGVAAQETGTNGTTTSNATTSTTTGAASNGTSTASSGGVSLVADPDAAGATANHTVTIPIGDAAAGNLTSASINYTDSNATLYQAPSSILVANLSNDRNIANNTSAAVINGRTLNFTFDLNESVESGQNLVLSYGGVENPPEPGTYDIAIAVRSSNGLEDRNAELTISEVQTTTGGGATGTTAGGETTTSGMATGTGTTAGAGTTGSGSAGTTGGSGTAGAGGTGAGETTGGNGPGFTALVAVVGVLAAALLAMRRS